MGLWPSGDVLAGLIDRVLGDGDTPLPAHVADLLRWCRGRMADDAAEIEGLEARIARALGALAGAGEDEE